MNVTSETQDLILNTIKRKDAEKKTAKLSQTIRPSLAKAIEEAAASLCTTKADLVHSILDAVLATKK